MTDWTEFINDWIDTFETIGGADAFADWDSILGTIETEIENGS